MKSKERRIVVVEREKCNVVEGDVWAKESIRLGQL